MKGLRQIVVGPSLQAPYPVLQGVAGGEHQHWGLAPLARLLQKGEPVHAGKHDIQHDEIKEEGRHQAEGLLGPLHPVYRVPFGLEGLLDQFPHAGVVLYEEKPHRPPFSPVCP